MSSAISFHPVTLTNLHPLGSQRRYCYKPTAPGPKGEEENIEAFRCAEQEPPITEGSQMPWKCGWANLSTGEPFPGARSTLPICKSISTALPKTCFQLWIPRQKGKKNVSCPGLDQFLQFPGSHEAPSTMIPGGWKLAPQPTMFLQHIKWEPHKIRQDLRIPC